MKNKILFSFLFITFFNITSLAQAKNEQPIEKKLIVIYGSDECHHCIETKAFLKNNNIDFVFFDLDKNPEALQEMLLKLRSKKISTSNLGIPVIDKNGELFSNNGDFEEFLQKLK